MKKITLVLFFIVSVIRADEWKELPEISNHPNYIHTHYESKDYHIRKDIDYFELRRFLFENGKQLSRKYQPFHIIAKRPLDSFPRRRRRAFKKLPFAENNTSYIKSEVYAKNYFHTSRFSTRINGYFIKNDNVLWTINEKKDLLWVFDGLDTEAELATFLWLYDDDYIVTCKYKYKETTQGYLVEKLVRTYPYSSGGRAYIDHTTYLLDIKRDGKFTIKRTGVKQQDLLRPLVIPHPPRGRKIETAESILKFYRAP